jgi:hypothetical protein
MRTIRGILLIYWPLLWMGSAYLLTVALVGQLWIAPADCPATYIATHTLQENRWLVKQDFQRVASGVESYGWFLPDRSELEGKYIYGKTIEAGQPVNLKDLHQWPDMTMSAGFRPVLVLLDDSLVLSGEINAGASVDVENATEIVAKGMTVHGLICPTPPGLQTPKTLGCFAVIDVPIASDAWITRGLKGLHVVLRNVANENK